MPLVRVWARGLSGASGAAALVPGGVLAALLLLAFAGSFGRLGGLGQALSGPAGPGSAGATSALAASHAQAARLLPILARQTAAATRSRGKVAGAPATGRPAVPSGQSPPGGEGTQPLAPGNPAGPNPPASSGCGSACTQPSPPTLVDRVVAVGTSLTSKLPGAVGTLTTKLLKQVAATVDQVLPTSTHNTATQLTPALARLKLR